MGRKGEESGFSGGSLNVRSQDGEKTYLVQDIHDDE